MLNQCPHCQTEMSFPDDEFYIFCKHCKGDINLDGSGNLRMTEKTAFLNTESLENQEAEAPTEAVVAEETKEVVVVAEPTEVGDQEKDPAEIALAEEVSTEIEDLESDSHTTVTHFNQDSVHEDTNNFSIEAVDFNSAHLYDLMISNIDSAKMQSDLISILNDSRLKLDSEKINKQFTDNVSGRVSLKDLSALKISYIVQNIYNASIPVDLYWEQKLDQ